MSEEINHHRRRFLGTAVMTIAAAELVMSGSADAQSSKINPADATTIKPGTNTSFGSLKQIEAGVLNVGYAEAGPTDGPAVILLHGWPYDIHSFVDVAPLLAAGYRVIVPHLRGPGRWVLHIEREAAQESNWLPAPNSPFYVIMGIYQPRPEVMSGAWRSPPMQQVN